MLANSAALDDGRAVPRGRATCVYDYDKNAMNTNRPSTRITFAGGTAHRRFNGAREQARVLGVLRPRPGPRPTVASCSRCSDLLASVVDDVTPCSDKHHRSTRAAARRPCPYGTKGARMPRDAPSPTSAPVTGRRQPAVGSSRESSSRTAPRSASCSSCCSCIS